MRPRAPALWPSPAAAAYGEQIAALRTGPAGRRDGRGRIAALVGQPGIVFYGPYLDLAAGDYGVTVLLRTAANPAVPGLTLEAVWGQKIIARRNIDAIHLEAGIATIEFTIPEHPHESDGPRFEVRLRTPGDIAVTIASVDLRGSEY